MSKNLFFGNKMTKVALGLHTWVTACLRELKHVYVGTFLRTQLGFQKHKKYKVSTIMAEVWKNLTLSRSHSKPHFFHYKKPCMVHFQNTQKSHEKNIRFTRK